MKMRRSTRIHLNVKPDFGRRKLFLVKFPVARSCKRLGKVVVWYDFVGSTLVVGQDRTKTRGLSFILTHDYSLQRASVCFYLHNAVNQVTNLAS